MTPNFSFASTPWKRQYHSQFFSRHNTLCMMILHFSLAVLAASFARLIPTVASDDDSSAASQSPGKKRRTTKRRAIGALKPDSEAGQHLFRCFLNWLENKEGSFRINPDKFNNHDLELYEKYRESKGLAKLGLLNDDIYTQTSLLKNAKNIAAFAQSEHTQRVHATNHEFVHGPKYKRKTRPSSAAAAAPAPAASAVPSNSRTTTSPAAAARPTSANTKPPGVRFNTAPQPSTNSSPTRPPTMDSLNESFASQSITSNANKAAWAEHENKPIGSNDGGGGLVETIKYDHNITLVSLVYPNNLVGGGCHITIHGASGLELKDYNISVSEAIGGKQTLMYSHKRCAAYREPERTTEAYEVAVPNPDYHPIHNNGVPHQLTAQAYPPESDQGGKIQRTIVRRKANILRGEIELPFCCERAIVSVSIPHPRQGEIFIEENPAMIFAYRPDYADCPDDLRKEFLKKRGMQRSLSIYLRKANDEGRKVAGTTTQSKVATSPTASAASDQFADLR